MRRAGRAVDGRLDGGAKIAIRRHREDIDTVQLVLVRRKARMARRQSSLGWDPRRVTSILVSVIPIGKLRAAFVATRH
jgi:hypothetical protein